MSRKSMTLQPTDSTVADGPPRPAHTVHKRAFSTFLFMLAPLIGAFSLFSLRILATPLWLTGPSSPPPPFVPILSPVYGQGAVWARTQTRTLAIIAHVAAGVVCLSCGLMQFDRTLRRARPALHRCTGRLYIVTGLVCVGSLQLLLPTVAQGRGKEGDGALQVMVNTTSVLWVVATSVALYKAAVQRDFTGHKRWMMRSILYAMVVRWVARRLGAAPRIAPRRTPPPYARPICRSEVFFSSKLSHDLRHSFSF